ncbi:uncharacterized protein J3R85_007464 [Psidium guajava]|nr:uncharacterized protein J3R85_007464 [Psidium guajava]
MTGGEITSRGAIPRNQSSRHDYEFFVLITFDFVSALQPD